MRELRAPLLIPLLALALVSLACSVAPGGGTPRPNTPPTTPTVAPVPTSTPVPVTPTPPAPTLVPPTEPATPSGLSQNELDALQAELAANVEKWRQAGLSDYAFEFRVNCFCPTDITALVNIAVRDINTIDSITYVETGEPVTENLELYLTVGGMFDVIQEAIDMRVANLIVSYHPELGYPNDVFIDSNFRVADEEHGFRATNLQPLGPPTLSEMQSRLDANREIWESNDLSSYKVQYRRICFCPPDITSPVIMSVSDGAIDSLTYIETGEPVGETVRDLFPTVPGLFDLVQDAIDREATSISVSYHSELGYPVSISIDYSTMIIDEELAFAVTSLQ